jgi:hypothetical protein
MPTTGEIERRDRLGGLSHEYYRTAAGARHDYWRPSGNRSPAGRVVRGALSDWPPPGLSHRRPALSLGGARRQARIATARTVGVRDGTAVTTRCECRTPSRQSVPAAATRPVLWADDRPALRLALALERVTTAGLGFDSTRYVRPKRRTSSSTLWRECVDGGPLSSVMAYRAPSDAR